MELTEILNSIVAGLEGGTVLVSPCGIVFETTENGVIIRFDERVVELIRVRPV
jgi:hypothetical protein